MMNNRYNNRQLGNSRRSTYCITYYITSEHCVSLTWVSSSMWNTTPDIWWCWIQSGRKFTSSWPRPKLKGKNTSTPWWLLKRDSISTPPTINWWNFRINVGPNFNYLNLLNQFRHAVASFFGIYDSWGCRVCIIFCFWALALDTVKR